MKIAGAMNRVLQWVQETECRKLGRKDRGHEVANAHRSRRAILQSGSGRKADDSSCTRAVSKVINDQHVAPRIVSLALLLTSLEAQFTASDPTAL